MSSAIYTYTQKPLSFELTFESDISKHLTLRTFGPHKTTFWSQISFQNFDNQGSKFTSTIKKNMRTKFTKHIRPNLWKIKSRVKIMNLEKQNNKNDDFISQQKVYTSSCSRFESVIVGSSNNLLHSLSFPHYTYIFSIFLNQTISNHSIFNKKS